MIQIQNSTYFLDEDNQVINSETGRILKQCIMNGGYFKVGIVVEGKRIDASIHRIIAHCHLGLDLSDSKTHVDHINGIRTDNRLENLRLCTRIENNNWGKNNKYNLPYYISGVKGKRGMFYKYVRTINGKRFDLKTSVNLDTIIAFKKEYENNH